MSKALIKRLVNDQNGRVINLKEGVENLWKIDNLYLEYGEKFIKGSEDAFLDWAILVVVVAPVLGRKGGPVKVWRMGVIRAPPVGDV